MPCHFDQRGDVIVCPDLDGQVCLLNTSARVLAQLGDGKSDNGPMMSKRTQPKEAAPTGKFVYPHDAIFLQTGDILVAEWLPYGRVSLLRRTSDTSI